MSAKWDIKQKEDLLEITKRIDKLKKINDEGKISFENGFIFQYNMIVLLNFLKMSEEITDLEKENILNKAIFNCGKVGSITPDKVLQEVKKCEKTYLKNKPNKYVLLSSLSVPKRIKMKSFKLDDKSIFFKPSISDYFVKEFDKVYRIAKYPIFSKLPENYIYVKTFVYARTPLSAMNKAMKFYNFYRGLLNLTLNRRNPIRISSGFPKPVNKFLSGPLSTLHYPNGKIVEEIWNYDLEYQYPYPCFDPIKHLDNIYKFEKYIRRRIKKIKYSKILCQAISDYGLALDSINWRSTFLRLWAILEQLTFAEPNEKHQTMIDRVLFLCRNRNYSKIILEQLRKIRNTFAHGNQTKETEILETVIYQLKNYVEVLIRFHLEMGSKFDNIEQIRNFLSLPCEQKNIEVKYNLLKIAKKFIKE